jgi:hypothetical protein
MTTALVRGLALAAVLTIATAGPLHAQNTTLSKFRSLIGRYAVSGVTQPKGACVCMDGSANDGRAGVLSQSDTGSTGFRGILVHCQVLAFNVATGSQSSVNVCDAFVPLGR